MAAEAAAGSATASSSPRLKGQLSCWIMEEEEEEEEAEEWEEVLARGGDREWGRDWTGIPGTATKSESGTETEAETASDGGAEAEAAAEADAAIAGAGARVCSATPCWCVKESLAFDVVKSLDSLARRPMAGRWRGSESCDSACGYRREDLVNWRLWDGDFFSFMRRHKPDGGWWGRGGPKTLKS